MINRNNSPGIKPRRRNFLISLEIESEDPTTCEYLSAEIQHSTREEAIHTGIKETLEYLAFLRVNEDYVFGRDTSDEGDIFGSGWNGLLAVQDLDQDTPSVDAQEDEPITILQAGELNEELPAILETVLNQ